MSAPGTPAEIHPCFFVADDGMSGEIDHDWQYMQDWIGDPGVVNGTATIYFRQCCICGQEESVSSDQLPDYDF